MKPLREDPQQPELARLLEQARAVDPFTPAQQEAGFRRVQATLNAPPARPSLWKLAVPALAAFALTVAVVPRLVREPPRTPSAPPDAVAELQLAPDARFEGSGGAKRLVAGAVVASAGARVSTPHLAVWVQSGSCRIQVAGDTTTLEVLSGNALVSEGGSAVERALPAGSRLQVGPGTKDAQAAPEVPAPVDGCAPLLELDARRSCYAKVALGTGLAAQNALFALGQLDLEAHALGSAAQYFGAYLQRYPDGALWPEAAAGILTVRLQERAWPQALEAAERYLARVPHGARSPEVRLIRANLWREHFGKVREAREAYRALTDAQLPPAVRAEALFGEALAARQLGESALARQALDAYAHDFPSGPHAAEVARMRSP